MENKIQITFSNRNGIRMGSPYMAADLHLDGLEIEIPNATWQDKFAISKDKKFIALIGFDFTDNEPGFEIFMINIDKKTITKTNRIFGLVNKISIDDGKIKFNKFLYDKTKSKAGKLCCNIDDEFDIE